MNSPDLTGKSVGSYTLVRVLGAGGMGTVYESYQESVQRKVAVKVLPEALAEQERYLERFKREVELAARMEHPHVLPVYDHGTDGKRSYIVMRMLTGGTLNQRLRREKFLTPDTAIQILRQIGSALDYAHSEGIVHRDLKPSNVLFDKLGNAYLSDFGISKILGATASGLTGTGQLIGTPSYMAPEQWEGDQTTARTDIYALGILAFVMLTGQTPFDAPTPLGLMRKHMYEEPPSAKDLQPELPDTINPVIAIALAKRPEHRFERASEFVDALESGARGDVSSEIIIINNMINEATETVAQGGLEEPVTEAQGTGLNPNVTRARPGQNLEEESTETVNLQAPTGPTLAEGNSQDTGQAPARRGALWLGLLVVVVALIVAGGIFFALDESSGADEDSTNGSSIERLITTGREELQERDFAAAVVRFSDALEQDENNAEAFALRAEANLALGRTTLAQADAERAITLDPTLSNAYLVRGTVALENGDYESAIADLNTYIEDAGDDPQALLQRGLAQQALGELDAARADFTAAQEADSQNPAPVLALARLEEEAANLDTALRHYSAAIRLDPGNPAIYIERGNLYLALDDPDNALLDFRNAINFDDAAAGAYLGLAIIAEAEGDFGSAIENYDRYLDLRGDDDEAENSRATMVAAEQTASVTPTPTASDTPTNTPSPSATATQSPSNTPSASATASATETPTPSPSATATDTQSPSATPTLTLSPTLTPSPSATRRPTQVAEVVDANDIVDEATAAFEAGDFFEARRLYTQALAVDAENAPALNGRGATLIELGNYSGAVLDLERAIEIDPNDATAYYNLGLAQRGTADFEAAQLALLRATELDPTNVDAWYVLGLTEGDLENYQGAIDAFSEVIVLGRGNPDRTYYERGVAYYNLGKLDEAIADLQQAIRINSSFTQAHRALGLAYEDKGQFEAAIESYRTYLGLVGVSGDAVIEERMENLETLLENGIPEGESELFDAGLAAYNEGNYRLAIFYFDRAISINDQDPGSYNNRGVAYYALGDYESALESFEAALALDPDYALSHYNSGLAYQAQFDYEAALAAYERAIAIRADYAEALYQRAEVLYEIGDFVESVASASRAIASDYTPLADVFNLRGNGYWYGLGNADLAIADYLRALENDPDFAPSHYNLGNIYFNQEEWELAQRYYSRYAALVGDANLSQFVRDRLNQLPSLIEANKDEDSNKNDADDEDENTNTPTRQRADVQWQSQWERTVEDFSDIDTLQSVVVAEGQIYVSSNARIFTVDPESGAVSADFLQASTFTFFNDFTRGADGNFWVTSPRPNAFIRVIAPSGQVLATYGAEDDPVVQRRFEDGRGPTQIEAGPDGNIYVVYEGRAATDILVLATNGDLLRRFTVTQNESNDSLTSRFGAFVLIAFDAAGNIFMTDFYGNAQLIDTEGEVLDSSYPDLRPAIIPEFVTDMVIDSNARIFMSAENGAVYVLNTALEVLAIYGTENTPTRSAIPQGDFAEPDGLALMPNGDLIVIDNNESHSQVLRIRP